ncbi:unnamed protein product [Clonostachys rosea]|uniref:Cytochrome b5 heme-binding domain-containing protein n=1 Tax=Bionectria ochroleuca TaxID=29856 RepID=A0ABY6UXG7_BIOOC|nr:unnamed protein product [Clonostachys rosea]
MVAVGISLIVASVVWVFFRPPGWLTPWLLQWRGFLRGSIGADPSSGRREARSDDSSGTHRGEHIGAISSEDTPSAARKATGKGSMPPLASIASPASSSQSPSNADHPSEEQTTPKALPAISSQPVPSFSIGDDEYSDTVPASTFSAPSQRSTPSLMPPPPRPANPPRLAQFPAANSAQRARGPTPNRGPSSSGLAPPPTHSSIPTKPSRKVVLTPGHSPLDWARISGPSADLRGVPSSTPYLRVTPSMLKTQTGRKGKDAWMGLNGKVYNITPYAEFHPGGIPELLRGAGKDATKIFGEVHPWVNYDTMLSACLVGLLVDEPEGTEDVSEMEQMD